ncbi:hypothetical protein ACO0M4_27245 [Streptomyces sp. RGM 3693]|uniref:hypothetical protein n=1 Tax=Streptomyces sp. RGM 3693 TaxID=3413284 RepID=UPI003D2DD667
MPEVVETHVTDQLARWSAQYREPTEQELEAPCGGCEFCQEAQSYFDWLLDIADGLWCRFENPAQFSYTVNGHWLHRTTCACIRRAMPTENARPIGETYDLAFRRWAHEHHDYRSKAGAARYNRHLLLEIMTPAEAREWKTGYIGSRGGREYRLCKVCRPDEP